MPARPRPRGNVAPAGLRWTIERAGLEFRLTADTLRRALNQNSAEPGEDGCYSTAQVCSAIFGGLNEEKLLTQRQLTRKYLLENSIVEASVLNRAELMKGLAAIADAFVSRLMAATEIPRPLKEDLLGELSRWPVVLEEVARNQSRLPRGNGVRREED
jgi:hypothetical protein